LPRTQGGVGFASTIAAAITTEQGGTNAALLGTSKNTNATVRGYGGGGSNVEATNGGNGYLGGGGGGGCSFNTVVPTGSGGSGGGGFVEVFSW